jgi:hypothetical protein
MQGISSLLCLQNIVLPQGSSGHTFGACNPCMPGYTGNMQTGKVSFQLPSTAHARPQPVRRKYENSNKQVDKQKV